MLLLLLPGRSGMAMGAWNYFFIIAYIGVR